MSAAYFSAAIPEPFRILGLTLKPLSLGRYRLLHRFDCAYVADQTADAGIGDLIIGVLICSMRCDEFQDFANSPTFFDDVRRWGKGLCPHAWIGWLPWIGKWWRKRSYFNVIEKMQLFRRYIGEAQELPQYWDLSEEATSSGAHWSQSMEVVLRGELGWTGQEIDEAPLSKALSDYFKWAETKGSIQLMTEYEIGLIAEAERCSAKGATNGP